MTPTASAAAYDPGAWESFAVAEVGAAAALAGLLVVACSINLARIIEIPSVVSRLATTLALFTGVLLAGTVLLVPGQGSVAVGVELAVIGLVMVLVAVRARGLRGLEPRYRRTTVSAAALASTAAALMTAAGVLEALELGGGLYWLFPGVVVAFSVGLLNAWVALIEILR